MGERGGDASLSTGFVALASVQYVITVIWMFGGRGVPSGDAFAALFVMFALVMVFWGWQELVAVRHWPLGWRFFLALVVAGLSVPLVPPVMAIVAMLYPL